MRVRGLKHRPAAAPEVPGHNEGRSMCPARRAKSALRPRDRRTADDKAVTPGALQLMPKGDYLPPPRRRPLTRFPTKRVDPTHAVAREYPDRYDASSCSPPFPKPSRIAD